MFLLQQLHYQGLIEYVVETPDDYDGKETEDDDDESVYVIPYGITGLVDKKTVLQCGEKVMNQHLLYLPIVSTVPTSYCTYLPTYRTYLPTYHLPTYHLPTYLPTYYLPPSTYLVSTSIYLPIYHLTIYLPPTHHLATYHLPTYLQLPTYPHLHSYLHLSTIFNRNVIISCVLGRVPHWLFGCLGQKICC